MARLGWEKTAKKRHLPNTIRWRRRFWASVLVNGLLVGAAAWSLHKGWLVWLM